jgi:N-glycosylase/DNA lyase
MASPTNPDPRALSAHSDEELIAQYQQDRSPAASTELLRRYQPQIHRDIADRARRVQLLRRYWADAEHEVLLALLEALVQYGRPRKGAAVRRCPGAFIHVVTVRTLSDIIRGLRRYHGHFEASLVASEVTDQASKRIRRVIGCLNALDWTVNDPGHLVAEREFWQCLEKVVDELGWLAPLVWDSQFCGYSLCALARELGVSERTVRRCWDLILSRLRDRFPQDDE